MLFTMNNINHSTGKFKRCVGWLAGKVVFVASLLLPNSTQLELSSIISPAINKSVNRLLSRVSSLALAEVPSKVNELESYFVCREIRFRTLSSPSSNPVIFGFNNKNQGWNARSLQLPSSFFLSKQTQPRRSEGDDRERCLTMEKRKVSS